MSEKKKRRRNTERKEQRERETQKRDTTSEPERQRPLETERRWHSETMDTAIKGETNPSRNSCAYPELRSPLSDCDLSRSAGLSSVAVPFLETNQWKGQKVPIWSDLPQIVDASLGVLVPRTLVTCRAILFDECSPLSSSLLPGLGAGVTCQGETVGAARTASPVPCDMFSIIGIASLLAAGGHPFHLVFSSAANPNVLSHRTPFLFCDCSNTCSLRSLP